MTRKILIFAALTLACVYGQAQSLVINAINGEFQMRLRPGTEGKVRQFFDGCMAGADSIVYVLIYPPANCPRCEAVMGAFLRNLKRVAPASQSAVVTVFPEEGNAMEYNGRQSFAGDKFLYDTADAWEGFLSTNVGVLHIPYVMKVNAKSGDIVAAFECNQTSEKFISELVQFDNTMPKHTFEESIFVSSSDDIQDAECAVAASFPVITKEGFTLSVTQYEPAWTGSKLAINDKLAELVVLFDREGDILRQTSTVTLTPEEKRAFTHIDADLYEYMNGKGELKFIPLMPRFAGDSILLVSYSLPYLWMMDTVDVNIGYKNQPCIYRLNLREGSSDVTALNHPDDSNYFFSHFTFYPGSNKYYVGCQPLTWPLSFEREEYEKDPYNDPFDDRFYDGAKPVLAAFDASEGTLLDDYVGNIPEESRLTKTGYAYNSPAYDEYGARKAWTDGFTGRATVDGREYRVFDTDTAALSTPDSSKFYTFEYMADYDGAFNRRIADMLIGPEKLYCLVRHARGEIADPSKDPYSVVAVDLATGSRTEKALPVTEGVSGRAFGLWRDEEGRVRPYSLERRADGLWYLNEYGM